MFEIIESTGKPIKAWVRARRLGGGAAHAETGGVR